MLTIKDFSELSGLTAQTLRYYHAEGLLVPAHVDEHSGYRSYEFTQIEAAVLVTVLRGAGLSVRQVRRALDEPDTALELLNQHAEEVAARRREQDEAIADARGLLTEWPDARVVDVPPMIVVSGLTQGRYEASGWDDGLADAAETARELAALVGEGAGPPWFEWPAVRELRQQWTTGLGRPHWQVGVPVEAEPASLPEGVWSHRQDGGAHVAVWIPGRYTLAKYGAALSRLVARPDSMPDFTRIRFVLHPDGVETIAPVLTSP
ncbi:MerR family transcriptional regulator [Catenuloplanes sp. NPDC051500]|uniref:MerR family transcriptional regulator n=1 Tax=Catenuloplanes sp. NPDC051500 TaxID=3363959 RepID=UPI0037A95DC4